ncbi:MauE/DoxX family redox-associated membrane protein [Novosphingobium sp. Chol11]|uniref:MauE/DoxX family redox-associated membrane protein n=1 Tax=Novosphingobium sp. Chol11 TaxID=1385763 RepID=UPI0025D45D90|nr:MauE/DoxX family redox-associated membrane protein [Novosphingobium sp. Chol11]
MIWGGMTGMETLPSIAGGLAMFGQVAAVAVGLVFVQAAIAKLRHRDLFPGVLANYRLLPGSWIAPVAVVLPWAELVIGLALLAGGQPLAILPAALLLCAFAAAMAVNIARGRRQIDCGCGRSQLRQPLSWLLVARNLVLAAMLLPRLLPAPTSSALDLGLALAGGVGLFTITMLFNAIGALAASPISGPAPGPVSGALTARRR